ncbi:AraC family transcriptional regulator [Alicyclobacillus fodiniaquatilis]|uniref:Helix-turn-helix domain-containing protein n=1 Tax=Alicyclobacillus fodiniaquatilis TaxID=1661150 RepID=A0ABW4JL83_9BACL
MTKSDLNAKGFSSKGSTVPFAFQLLEENRFALDRLDLTFAWGNYGIRVLNCHLMKFQAGQVLGFHKHSDYEFHFIPRGKGKVILDNQEHNLHEGMFYLTGPGVLHYQECDKYEPMNELCLHIDIQSIPDASPAAAQVDKWGTQLECQEAQQCIEQLNALQPVPMVDQYNAMQWFLTAYRAWYENRLGAYTTIKNAIIQIMLRTVQNASDSQGPFDIPQRDMNTYRYQMATQFIQDNYANAITLNEVAERLHISGRQLQRIFEQHGGGSFKSYLENIRLSHVCRALIEGDRSFEQIAEQHGFSSSNYLYNVFKKKIGLTPGQFKKMYRQSERFLT